MTESDDSYKSAEKAVKEIKGQVRAIVERFAHRVGNLLVAETVKVIDENKKNATGELRKSITYEFSIFGTYLKIVVFSPLDYAFYAHEGRRPGGVPPVYKIRDWVRIKGITGRYSVKNKKRLGSRMDQYWEDNQAAVAIAFKIAKHGTVGLKFFDLALRNATPKIETLTRESFA